jgi:hypothetical protein
LPTAAALVASGAWAFNFHGINMAVLWISGRTALLATGFALLAAIAHLKGRGLLAAAFCLLAMLSKEEAVLLPMIAAAWSSIDAGDGIAERARVAARRAWPWFAALAIYLVLRLRTEAFWPADAPAYYRLTFSPAMLLGNALQYTDRALTTAAIAAVIVFLASGARARLDRTERRIVVFGAIWLVATFAITVFVPARSSLYAVLPSVGSSLAAAAVAAAAARAAPVRTRRALIVLATLPLLLVPLYWERNQRWVRLADLSSASLRQVTTTGRALPGRPIVLVDSPAKRFNLDAAFGTLWPDAAALCLPATIDATIGSADSAPANAIVLRLANGRLIRED